MPAAAPVELVCTLEKVYWPPSDANSGSTFCSACEASKSSTPLSPAVAGPIPGVTISAPKMLEPVSGVKIAVDKQPVTLLIENASTSGVRPLTYSLDIATDANFNNKVFTRDGIQPGDAGRTSLKLPDPLGTGHTYFWRAKAVDGANEGPYANAMASLTPKHMPRCSARMIFMVRSLFGRSTR